MFNVLFGVDFKTMLIASVLIFIAILAFIGFIVYRVTSKESNVSDIHGQSTKMITDQTISAGETGSNIANSKAGEAFGKGVATMV